MPAYNRIQLMGNITRDPVLRYTKNGAPVANFGLAVDRPRSKRGDVDFFEVSAWRERGKAIVEHKKKGDPIFVEGHMEHQTYTDGQGTKRSRHVVVATEIQYLGQQGPSSTTSEAVDGTNNESGGEEEDGPRQESEDAPAETMNF